MAEVTVTKIAGYVRVRILMNRWFFRIFGIHIFQVMANLVNLVYDSLQPSQRSLCLQRKRLSLHYTKIGDAGCIRLHVNQPLQRRRRGLWTSLALLVGRGPRTLVGPRWQIGETMNKGGPLTMVYVDSHSLGQLALASKRIILVF